MSHEWTFQNPILSHNIRSYPMKLLHLLFGLMLALCSAVTFAQAVDINTASAEQLAKAIKGIGPTKAAAIVKYRETTGPFKSVDDLTKVPGIKSKALEKLLKDNKEMLTVGGAATVPAAPTHAAPAAPVMPTAPATPIAPAKPTTLPTPAAPVVMPTPTAPAKPTTSSTPAAPATPTTPATPVAPAK